MCVLLGTLILGQGGVYTYAVENDGAAVSVSNLKVNLLDEAYGIPAADPAFSWTIESGNTEVLQQAYELIVAHSEEEAAAGKGFYTSGRIASSQSAGVVPENLVLEKNHLYYWSVKVEDNKGNTSAWAQPQPFTTETEWSAKTGIWDNTAARTGETIQDPFRINGWTDYAVELDINPTIALGVAFRGQNAGADAWFLQFRSDGNLVPHKVANGNAAAYGTAGENVLPTDGKPYRVKIQIIGEKVTTYIKTAEDQEFVQAGDVITLDGSLTYGSVGFRTGRTESGEADNIEIYPVLPDGSRKLKEDGSGETLFSCDFEDGSNPFSTGSAANGVLSIPKEVLTPSLLRAEAVYPEYTMAGTLAPRGNFIFARNEFQIPDLTKVKKAVVSVTAKSPEKIRQYVYSLYVNGQFAGLGPARFDIDPADNSGILYYNSFDVTDQLLEGTNAIGAVNYTSTEKSFLCQLTVFDENGNAQVITNSGESEYGWKTKDGTNAFGDDGTGIGTSYFSAAAQNLNSYSWPEGWNLPGYEEDLSWAEPIYNGAIVNSFDLTSYPADRVGREEITPASVTEKGEGSYFIDLGKEIAGGFKLAGITSDQAAKIEIRYGEELENGAVKWQMRTGNKYREFWTLKKSAEPYSMENTGMMTYRYVEISGCPAGLTTENVRGIAIRQAFSEGESSFRSENALLNQIYNLTKYSIQATNQDLMVDSQSRERGSYEGDVLINALSSYSFEDDYALARFSNEYLITHRTWPVEYVLLTIHNAWNDYMYTGDRTSLESYYTKLKAQDRLYWNYLNQTYQLLAIPTSAQNTTNAVLVDWPVSEQDGFERKTFNTVMNAVAYSAYADLAKIAEALGKTAEQGQYQGYADTIKKAMIEQLYDSAAGAFVDGMAADGTKSGHYSQHATAYALSCGVYDSPEMAEKLAAYLDSQGEIRMSVYGSYFLLDGLYKAGNGNAAMKMMTSTGTRSWNHMLNDLKATITTEAWDPANKPNMTWSHPWGSAPASQIVRGMFGIQPLKPGFEEFQIKFQPGDVAGARVEVPTVKGKIAAEYTKTDKNFQAEVTVPANTQTVVYVPLEKTTEQVTLVVDGKSVPVGEAGSQAEPEGSFLKIKAGSGMHTIALSYGNEMQDPEKKRIAHFTFDDRESGFSGDDAVAVYETSHYPKGVSLRNDGYRNRALYLEGKGGDDEFSLLQVTKKDGSSLLTGVEELTVSFYSRLNKTGNSWAFYAAPDSSSPVWGSENYVAVWGNQNAGYSTDYFDEGRSNPKSVRLSAAAQYGEWNHVVAVCAKDAVSVYIDGILVNRAEKSAGSLADILGDSSILQIGKANWQNGEYYQGYLDEFSIYNYAMSESEVKELEIQKTETAPETGRTIYFDNELSRLAAAGTERVYYSVDQGITWIAMDKLSKEQCPKGDYVCTKDLWKAVLEENAQTVQFRAYFRTTGTLYPSDYYTSENYVLSEVAASDGTDCFYGAPPVNQLNYDGTGSGKHTLLGGFWGSVNQINTAGDLAQTVSKEGKFQKDENVYYANASFYDYYSDYELWGKKLCDSGSTNENSWQSQPLYAWNLGISNYYRKEGNSSIYPLYFGGSRMLAAATTSDNLKGILLNHENNISYGNGASVIGKRSYLNNNGGSFPNMGLLAGEPLDAQGNLYLKNSVQNAPYFNEDFLRGNNGEKAAYGSVYNNLKFPFTMSDSGYWSFDSSINDGLRVYQEADSSQYYLKSGGKTIYKNQNFFFPFSDAGTYADESRLDYMFGMKLDVPFALNKERQIWTDETAKDCVFTFSGDDDVWIFIEDESGNSHLVLDLGGSHGAVAGAIDFKTGIVASSGKWGWDTQSTENAGYDKDNAYAMNKKEFLDFMESQSNTGTEEIVNKDAAKTFIDDKFYEYVGSSRNNELNRFSKYGEVTTLSELGVDLKPYENYKIKIYYMERGLDESNLRITFAFPIVKTVGVVKEWIDGQKTEEHSAADVSLYEMVKTADTQPEGDTIPVNKVPADHIGGEGEGTESADGYLDQTNNWSYEWKNLRAYVNTDSKDEEYKYYIAETNVPEGYVAKYYDDSGAELKTKTLLVDCGDGTTESVEGVLADETVRVTIKNVKYGSVKVHKTDGEKKNLAGVKFSLTEAEVTTDDLGIETWSKVFGAEEKVLVTDEKGEVFYDNLLPGTYLLTETETVKGASLLEKPVQIRIPYKAENNQAEAIAGDSKGIVRGDYTYYYDLTYEIRNDQLLSLPESGGWNRNRICICIGMLCMTVAGAESVRRRRKKKCLSQRVG